MASAEQPSDKVARLKEELKNAETELEEAASMRAEAQGLGEEDMIAELASVEERLQAEILELKAELLAAQSEASAAASAALRARMAKLRQSALSRSRVSRQLSDLPTDLPAAEPSGASLASQHSSASADTEALTSRLTTPAVDNDAPPSKASAAPGSERKPAARADSGRSSSSPRRSTFSVADVTASEPAATAEQLQHADEITKQAVSSGGATEQPHYQPQSSRGTSLQQMAAGGTQEAQAAFAASEASAAAAESLAEQGAQPVGAENPSWLHASKQELMAQEQQPTELPATPPALAALSAKLPTDAFSDSVDAYKASPEKPRDSSPPAGGSALRVDAFPPEQHAAEQGNAGLGNAAVERAAAGLQGISPRRSPAKARQPAADAWADFAGDQPDQDSVVPSQPGSESFSPTTAGFVGQAPSPQQQQLADDSAAVPAGIPQDGSNQAAAETAADEPATSYTEAVINTAAAAAKGVAVALGISDTAAENVDSTADAVRQALEPSPFGAAPAASQAENAAQQTDAEGAAPPAQAEAAAAEGTSSPTKLDREAVVEGEQPAGQRSSAALPPVATREASAADTSSPKFIPSRTTSPAAGARGSPSKYRHASSKALPVGRSKPGTPSTSQPGSPAQSQPHTQSPSQSPLQQPGSAPTSPFSLQSQGSGPCSVPDQPKMAQPAAQSAGVDAPHSTATAEADAMEAGMQHQEAAPRAEAASGVGADAWGAFGAAQANPDRQISLPTRQAPPPPPPEPDSWQQPDASAAPASGSIEHAWSGNPFMDFKLSGGIASAQSARSEEPDPFSSSGFASQNNALAAPQHQHQQQAPGFANSWDAPVTSKASQQSSGFEDVPATEPEQAKPAPSFKDRPTSPFGNQSAMPFGDESSKEPGMGSAHTGSFIPQDEWASSAWGDAFAPESQPRSSTAEASVAAPAPQQSSSQEQPASKPSFAAGDAWADFGSSKPMLSLDRGAFGAPKQASGSLLNVSLPSKHSQGGFGMDDLLPAASGRSWDDSPMGSREASPERSLPSRHSQRAEDNPFEADFDSMQAPQPESSQTSASGSTQSRLGKRLSSLKQMNSSVNKSAKQMLKSEQMRKLQDAMKVKWRGRTTTEEDPTPDASAPESEVSSRGISGTSAAWGFESAGSAQPSVAAQDSFGANWGGAQPQQQQQQQQQRLAALAASEAPDPVMAWPTINPAVKEKCQAAYKAQGLDTEDAGMQSDEAMVLFMRIKPPPACGFRTLFRWCDLDDDGKLNQREFCLFMYMLKAPQHTAGLGSKLGPVQAAHVLGEPAPVPSRESSPEPSTSQFPSHLSPWLQPIKTEQAGSDGQDQAANEPSTALSPEMRTLTAKGYQEDDCKRALFLHANDVKPALEWLQERFGKLHSSGPSSDLTSTLSLSTRSPDLRASAPKGFEFRADPSSPPGSRGPRLQILVERADVPHYKKALDGPFFALALRDGNGALLESELATPPGHFDRDAGCIVADHAITFRTPIMDIPEGAALFFEVRHYKMQERRLSTLAWSFIPAEVFILHHHQSGGSPMSPRLSGPKVRTGPMFLSLYHKPTDERIHARSHLHHAAAIARRGPKPIGKVHDLFISVLVA